MMQQVQIANFNFKTPKLEVKNQKFQIQESQSRGDSRGAVAIWRADNQNEAVR
jgi:hypothetical protein